ncbi:hypothetical protein HETIRDRAFT_431137 [Heterobasidion irregulare TC 32-1]|uniref:Uncharacterized protein n=1 Tax=Heterobasidion irregulare (strain TC 32-1) TaxID=747525 RepID=W4JN48_HETIT|nr:uncharacterized protein HETIRDRAFT_431137 [Heterobasidion irregulare TC 32-1]ETW74963.1 hypothetical protein HETIRDRAFT_431137 [Heterobasidion irregulare TC 32-1]
MSLVQYIESKGTIGKDTRKHTLSDCDYHRDRMPLPVILGDYNVLALTCGKDCAHDAAHSAIGDMYRLGSKDRSNGGDERIERQCRRLSPVRLVQGSERPNASPLFAKSACAMTYDDTPGSLFKLQLCIAARTQPRGAACLRRLLHETSGSGRDSKKVYDDGHDEVRAMKDARQSDRHHEPSRARPLDTRSQDASTEPRMGAETTSCQPERRELKTIAEVERARCSHQPQKFRMAMHEVIRISKSP